MGSEGSDVTGDRRLAGRVVLVTGAARGIGRAVAEAISSAGGAVVACDLRPEVRDLGDAAFVADAASVDDMVRVVDHAVTTHGRLDAVVANAGAAELSSADLDVGEAVAMFDRMITANLRTAYVTVRAALPHLVVAGRADIVLVSTDHVCPRPGSRPKVGWMEGYDAAKWGLEGLVRNWAATLGRHGVRVNALAMGETDTPMLRDFLTERGVSSERIDEMAAGWLTAADIADVAVALLAEHEPSRSGTTIGLWPGFPPPSFSVANPDTAGT
jgi:NAD(P)-dependent dehydrogenase (short-subunit alcohol dehydrogenase family)